MHKSCNWYMYGMSLAWAPRKGVSCINFAHKVARCPYYESAYINYGSSILTRLRAVR